MLLLYQKAFHLVDCPRDRHHFLGGKLPDYIFGLDIDDLDDRLAAFAIQAELDSVVDRFQKIIDCLDCVFQILTAGLGFFGCCDRLFGLRGNCVACLAGSSLPDFRRCGLRPT